MTIAEYATKYSLDISAVPAGSYTYTAPNGDTRVMKITRPARGAYDGWTFARVVALPHETPDYGRKDIKIATQHPTKDQAKWSDRADRRKRDLPPVGWAGLSSIAETHSEEQEHECPEYSICQRCYA